MELKKIDFLVEVPRGGKIEHVQCYARKASAWASREYRKLMEDGETELAVVAIVQQCCVTEKYEPAFTEEEAQKLIDGDVIADLYQVIAELNEFGAEKKS